MARLNIAHTAKLVVDRYVDNAVGALEKNADGKLAVTRVRLQPAVTFGGRQPTAEEVRALHEKAQGKVVSFVEASGHELIGLAPSVIAGADGNREFFICARKRSV